MLISLVAGTTFKLERNCASEGRWSFDAGASLVEEKNPRYPDEMSRWIVHDLFSKIPESHGHIALSVAFAQFIAVKCDVDPFDHETLEALLRETSCAQEVLRWFLRLLQSGHLRSASRPIGGGALTKITHNHWQADDVIARFLTSQYCRAEPFATSASPDAWIFVDQTDFLRLWKEHTEQMLGVLPVERRAGSLRKAPALARAVGQPSDENHLLSLPAVEQAVGLGSSSIYKLIAEGRFPAQIKIGNRSLWRRVDIARWVAELGR